MDCPGFGLGFPFWYTRAMATKIYDNYSLVLLDGTEIYLIPLKIKYLREFMERFEFVKSAVNDDDAIDKLVDCVAIAMKQFYPELASKESVEDNCDISMIYKIIEVGANIKMKQDVQESVVEQVESKNTWDTFDLAKLESELFLLGIWRDYEELESSLSLPEITATLESKRDLDYQEKKFLAAIQGVNLDEHSGQSAEDPWEKMKAKVFSNNGTTDPNDILAYQGVNAEKAGFGLGMGLGYTKID